MWRNSDQPDARTYRSALFRVCPRIILKIIITFLRPNTDPTHYDIMAGDWDNTETEGTEQQIKITKFHIHPKFQGNESVTNLLLFNQTSTGDQDLPTDDMLILELETPVTLTDFVTIANLPKRCNGSLYLPLPALYSTREFCVGLLRLLI